MRSDLPTGVVTMLFTDVEGSTRLLHELGDGYAGVLDEHRRVLRDTFTRHGGVEVDTQGDAFFVAFASAAEGVAAAADGQRELLQGPLRVRMGLHTGEPRLTDEGYVGLDVHRAARIAAAGHGGQVLLSEATRGLVDASARDLGPYRLKDLSAPERIFQLEVEGLAADFPPLKTLDAGIANLPAPRTAFVGRRRELEEIERLLEQPDCRLLTLVGPGGVGKTRLALEAAARRVEQYPHGVHLVPLAPVAASDFIAPAMAEALQFPVDSAHSAFSAQDQLLDYLSERSTLLVLDNLEHLLDGCGLLAQVIERAPNVELIVTSRERLNLQSEWVLDVDGLALDRANGGREAIDLFLDRARHVQPGFDPSGAELDEIARICGLVGGMPLGIELAASWVPTLQCREIGDEIERGIDFLATSMRDVPERHRSLRAAFDQSWRLLDDPGLEVFSRLSVFRGSFDRDAAAAVAGADLRTLSDLVAKSLVRRLGLGRYELHELLRSYAAEALAERPVEHDAAKESHARHYVGMLLDREAALLGADMATARDELRQESDNLLPAAEWTVTHWDEHEVRRLLDGLRTYFFMHSDYEGAEALQHLAEVAGGWPAPEGPVEPAGAVHLSTLAFGVGMRSGLGYDAELERLAVECERLCLEGGLWVERLECLLALGILETYRDTYDEAADHLEQALTLSREHGNTLVVGAIQSWLGFVRLLQGDLDASRRAFEDGYRVSRASGNPLLIAYLLSKLGLLADAEGDFATAIEKHTAATGMFESVGDRGGTGYTLSRASMSAFCLGDFEEAARLARAGFEAFSEVNHRWGVITATCRLGWADVGLGDTAAARRHLGNALARAGEDEAVSLALHALTAYGAVLAAEGEKQRAAEVLCFALAHPALPEAYAVVARPTMEAVESELSPAELDAARASAAEADLAGVIDAARRDLGAGD